MELCLGRARYWGDLDDSDSEVSKYLAGKTATRLLEADGTNPSCYYVSKSQ
jgi:molybdopterin-containing oxidoreductase family iron-sulfur binding subunit